MNDWQAVLIIIVSVVVPLGTLIIGMGAFVYRSLSKRIDRNGEMIDHNGQAIGRLEEKIARLDQKVVQNSEMIDRNGKAIRKNTKAINRLAGYKEGRTQGYKEGVNSRPHSTEEFKEG